MPEESQACQTCSYWVPLNSVHAGRGECTHPKVCDMIRHTVDPEEGDVATAFVTPFDFGCVLHYHNAADDVDDAQCSPA